MDRTTLKNTLLSMIRTGKFFALLTPTKFDDQALAWAEGVFSQDHIYDMLDKLLELLQFMKPDDVIHILETQLVAAKAAQAPK